MTEPVPPDLAIRLLRAKAAEMEHRVSDVDNPDGVDYLTADVALIATLLADHMDRSYKHEHPDEMYGDDDQPRAQQGGEVWMFEPMLVLHEDTLYDSNGEVVYVSDGNETLYLGRPWEPGDDENRYVRADEGDVVIPREQAQAWIELPYWEASIIQEKLREQLEGPEPQFAEDD